jgi:hypothetical protein
MAGGGTIDPLAALDLDEAFAAQANVDRRAQQAQVHQKKIAKN